MLRPGAPGGRPAAPGNKRFIITESRADTVHILHLQGSLDGNTCVELESKIATLIEAGRNRLVVDPSKLNYVASAGIGVFISAQHRLQASGGTFHLADPSAAVREVFMMLGLSSIIPIHPTLERGVAAARV